MTAPEPAPAAHAAPKRPLAPALLLLAFAAAAFGDRSLGPAWLRVGDVLGGVFLIVWAAAFWRGEWRGAWPRWSTALALFVGASLLSGSVAWLAGDAGFAPVEFVKSAARLFFGASLALAVAVTLSRAGVPRAARLLQATFAVSGLIGLGLYALLVMGAPLPRSLVCGQERETCSAFYYERRWFGDASPEGLQHDVFVRAQGLSSEPTRFGTLQALALGALLLRRPLAPAPGIGQALVALGALASFALAPYSLLALAGLLFGLDVARSGTRDVRRRVVLVGLLLIFALALPPLGPGVRRIVFGRIERMAQGGLDSSAFLRVSGGWVMARELLAARPLTGVGLGQFDVAVAARRERLPAAHLLGGSIQGWNVLSYVLGTTGVLGLLAFLGLCWSALRPQPWAAPVFVLGLFADGTLLAPAFWVLLALYAQAPDDAVTRRPRSLPAPRVA